MQGGRVQTESVAPEVTRDNLPSEPCYFTRIAWKRPFPYSWRPSSPILNSQPRTAPWRSSF